MDEPSTETPVEVSPPVENKVSPSKFAIMVAMRDSHGNRAEAARRLGMNLNTLKSRIFSDKQLHALYANKEEEKALGEIDVIGRDESDLPPTTPSEAIGIPAPAIDRLKMISLVSPEDTERLLDGLKSFDFSDASLSKIRALGSLAEDTGRFIAVSLEKTHQNYIVQQFGLMELAADIKKKILAQPGDKNHISDTTERQKLHHCYVELVKESGRGVKLSIEMAEVITRMLESASAKSGHAGIKPGWRKVTAAEAESTQPPPNA